MLSNPLLTNTVQAQQTQGFTYVNNLVSVFVTLAIIIGAIIFFFILVYGAIMFITSTGDKGKLETARNTIFFALAGIILLFSVFAIVKLIEFIFGVDILVLDLARLIIGGGATAPGSGGGEVIPELPVM